MRGGTKPWGRGTKASEHKGVGPTRAEPLWHAQRLLTEMKDSCDLQF